MNVMETQGGGGETQREGELERERERKKNIERVSERESEREREREREREVNAAMRGWFHLFQPEEPRLGLWVQFLNIGLDLRATESRAQGSSLRVGIV